VTEDDSITGNARWQEKPGLKRGGRNKTLAATALPPAAKIAARRQALPPMARNARRFSRLSAIRSAMARHTMPGMDDAIGKATDGFRGRK
jgi:hypothetical protein